MSYYTQLLCSLSFRPLLLQIQSFIWFTRHTDILYLRDIKGRIFRSCFHFFFSAYFILNILESHCSRSKAFKTQFPFEILRMSRQNSFTEVAPSPQTEMGVVLHLIFRLLSAVDSTHNRLHPACKLPAPSPPVISSSHSIVCGKKKSSRISALRE